MENPSIVVNPVMKSWRWAQSQLHYYNVSLAAATFSRINVNAVKQLYMVINPWVYMDAED